MTARRYRIESPGYPEQVELVDTELRRRGWRETDGDDWELFWSFDLHPRSVFRSLMPDRRLNHLPGALSIHAKDELHHFLRLAAGRVDAGDGWYDFFPLTFVMPHEHDDWRRVAAEQPDTLWLRKPVRLTGGRGQQILTDPADLVCEPGWLVQEYIADPFLLPGEPYKHVLRIYVLVTSLDPLVAYIHPTGPIKLTSRPFGTRPDELADRVRHFTNPSVQLTNRDVDDPVRNMGWAEYRKRLREAGHDPIALWQEIRHMLTQSIIAHRDPLLNLSRHLCPHVAGCFELLGYDITLDASLKPWILECNISPSLGLRGDPGGPNHAIQRDTKASLVSDVLAVVGVDDDAFADGYGPAEHGRELRHRGRFEVLYPGADAQRYRHCFEQFTTADAQLAASSAG